MNDSMENLSDDELRTIIRQAENTDIPGSRHQKAKAELEIRHNQKILETAKAKNRPSFINIAQGAKIKNLRVTDNKVAENIDFLNNEGELEDSMFDGNEHGYLNERKNMTKQIINVKAHNFKNSGIIGQGNIDKRSEQLVIKEKYKVNWQKWATITGVIIGICSIIATIIFSN
jgi:hypothetical protein